MKPLLLSLLVLQTAVLAPAESKAPPPPAPRLGLPEASVKGEKAPAVPVSEYIHYLAAPAASSPGTGVAAVAPPDRLQTAIVRFQKEGTVVDLIGVVHVADAAYYHALNERFREYDAVLYEMVGGPHRPDGEVDQDGAPDELGSLRQLQKFAKALLGLEFQLDAVDYSAPNLVHADVAWSEFDALMEARNETILTLVSRAMNLSAEQELPGVPSDEAAVQAMLNRLFSAVLTGNSAELKRTVAPFLSEAENLITRIEAEDGTVLVSERNRVVMEKLAEVRAGKGPGKYAIFYGAGHMPDLESRLVAEGFVRGDTTWLDAWTIPAGASGPPSEGSPVELLLKLLAENPEIMNGVRDLGTMLEDLGGALKSLNPPEPVQ